MPTGSDVVKLANKHIGGKYVFGVKAPKNNADWKGPWDCAEFASWVTYQLTGILVGCTNNQSDPALADAYSGAWARDAATLGKAISLGQAKGTAGAVLIRKPNDSAIGHVAFSRGDGSTIEAHSKNTGVSVRKVDGRHWDLAMVLPLVTYPSPLPELVYAPPTEVVWRLTSPPMHGGLVRKLQVALKKRGFNPGAIDGIYGPHTEAAVRAYQLSMGLVPDGEAGAVTIKKLGLVA